MTFGHAATEFIHDSNIILGHRKPLITRPAVPLHRHGVIASDAYAIFVHDPEIILAQRVSLIGRTAVPFDRFEAVFGNVRAEMIKTSQFELGRRVALLCPSAIELFGFDPILASAFAGFIFETDIVVGLREILAGREAIQIALKGGDRVQPLGLGPSRLFPRGSQFRGPFPLGLRCELLRRLLPQSGDFTPGFGEPRAARPGRPVGLKSRDAVRRPGLPPGQAILGRLDLSNVPAPGPISPIALESRVGAGGKRGLPGRLIAAIHFLPQLLHQQGVHLAGFEQLLIAFEAANSGNRPCGKLTARLANLISKPIKHLLRRLNLRA